MPVVNGEFVLIDLLLALRERKIYSLFVEGGAKTYGSFLNQNLVDRLYLFLAPKMIGKGLAWNAHANPASLEKIRHLARVFEANFGEDSLITGRLM